MHKDAMPVLLEINFARKILHDNKNHIDGDTGIIAQKNPKSLSGLFLKAIMQGRFWAREARIKARLDE
jgi:hypothetical protein